MIRLISRSLLIIALIYLTGCLITGCEPSPADKARSAKLAKVQKIALVTFIGRSKTSPSDTVHHYLIQTMWEAFKAKADAATNVIRFLPYEEIVNNEAYKRVATVKLPKGAYSPIEGLTYIKYGIEGGFDCGPLFSALKADALLLIVAQFGIEIKQNGSAPYLTVNVYSGLFTPPEELVWGNMQRGTNFEEDILVSIVDHPKLMGSIGAKWVLLQRPSESEYAELTRIAIDRKTQLPKRAGESVFDDMISNIKKARESAAKQITSK